MIKNDPKNYITVGKIQDIRRKEWLDTVKMVMELERQTLDRFATIQSKNTTT